MSQRVASLFAEIGADTKGFEQGAGKVKASLQDQQKMMQSFGSVQKQKAKEFEDAEKRKWKAAKDSARAQAQAYREAEKQQRASARAAQEAANEQERAHQKMVSGLQRVAIALVAIGVAAKKGYDFAKEGADIQFTAERFDRLAQSIGSTGDVLLGKMKEATKGTLSDMEAMAAATDILSLGLADTQEQAIRLATVQSGLAMDTNQLVLALTNQTTMRFDQLGVSVTGFEDKVKALEEAGYSAQDAFTEAFLQQAEEQLLKVGNAADAAAGQFKIFEAGNKNATDQLKESWAEAVLPLIEYVNVQRAANDETNRIDEIYKSYANSVGLSVEELEALRWGVSDTDAEFEVFSDEVQRAEEYGRAWSNMLGESIPIIKEVEENTQELHSLMGDFQGIADTYIEKTDELKAKEAELLEEKAKLISQGYSEEGAKIGEVNAKLDENIAKQGEAAEAAEEASKRRIAALVEQGFMADGVLTQKELGALLKLETQWGLMSQEAATSAMEVNSAVQEYLQTGDVDTFTSSIDGATKALLSMPDEKTIRLNLVTMVNGQTVTEENYYEILNSGT